jgi:hypothetical protein
MLVIGLAWASVYLTTPIVAATYDVSRDFLSVANPTGPWSYGWKSTLTGAFTLLPYHGAESDPNGGIWEHWYRLPSVPASVYRNSGTATLTSDGGQGIYPPGTVWFGAGFDGNPDNFGVIRFTVPPGGGGTNKIVTVVRSRLNGPIAGDTDFHVVHNGTELFGQNLPPDSSAAYTNTLSLAEGDTIDFMAGHGLDGREYGGGLKISATISRPSDLSIRVSQVELCWPTISNVTYQLQYREALSTNGWLPLGGPLPGNGSRFCTNDVVLPDQPRRFYQLSVTNSP